MSLPEVALSIQDLAMRVASTAHVFQHPSAEEAGGHRPTRIEQPRVTEFSSNFPSLASEDTGKEPRMKILEVQQQMVPQNTIGSGEDCLVKAMMERAEFDDEDTDVTIGKWMLLLCGKYFYALQ
ncbi:hypothetical protein BX666DRAFT_1874719 [Dichotomocladium elegans]|nr:hypothetical protein BX666DRAFT_1874719 [Dichotomocladium elegans]